MRRRRHQPAGGPGVRDADTRVARRPRRLPSGLHPVAPPHLRPGLRAAALPPRRRRLRLPRPDRRAQPLPRHLRLHEPLAAARPRVSRLPALPARPRRGRLAARGAPLLRRRRRLHAAQAGVLLRDCLRCEVFDSWRMAWRRSADVAVWPESLVETAPAVRAYCAMHWLRWPDRLSGAEDIFAFDVKSETWRLIGLPPEATEKRWARKKVAAVEGKLCLVVVVDEEVEIWVLASYRQERWEKKMTASLTRLAMEEGNSLILRDLYTSHIAFFNSVLWYGFLRGKIAEAPVRHKCIQQVFKFESDLVPSEEIDERPDSAFKWDCEP